MGEGENEVGAVALNGPLAVRTEQGGWGQPPLPLEFS